MLSYYCQLFLNSHDHVEFLNQVKYYFNPRTIDDHWDGDTRSICENLIDIYQHKSYLDDSELQHMIEQVELLMTQFESNDIVFDLEDNS